MPHIFLCCNVSPCCPYKSIFRDAVNTIIKLWHSQLKLILCKYIRHLVFMLKLAILSFFLYAHAILLLVARSYTCKNCILRGFMYFFLFFFFPYRAISATKYCSECWLGSYVISHYWTLMPLLRIENNRLVVHTGSPWTRDSPYLGYICIIKVWLQGVSSLL